MTVAVDRRAFALELASPLSTARGTIDRREGWLLRVEDGDGRVGLGEATPLPGWTESREACREALSAAADALREAGVPDPRDAAGSHSLEGSHPALAATAGAPAARHAVSLAALDLAARRAGVALSEFLGGDGTTRRVPVNGTVGDGSPGETARAALAERRRGFDRLKVKVGARSVAGDLQRLVAVREALGDAGDAGGDATTDADGTTLRLDANGAWTPAEAREALDGLASAGIDPEYVEQPLPAEDLAGLAELRAEAATPVAVDESLAEFTPREVVDAGAADVLVCKPMALGGVDRAVAAARTARAAGLAAVLTTTVDGVVARTAAVHAAASLPDPPACGLATADRLASDLGPDPCPVEDGRIAVPRGEGNGPTARWWSRD